MADIKEVLEEFLSVPVHFSEISLLYSYIYDEIRNGERLSQDSFDTIYGYQFDISDEYDLFRENDIDDYSHYFDHDDDDYYHLTADGLDGARKLGINFKEYDAKKFQYFVIKINDDLNQTIRKRFSDLDFIFHWLKDDYFVLITQNEVDGKKVEKFLRDSEVEFSKF